MNKIVKIGIISGGLIGFIVSITMDLVIGNSLGGSWSDAVAHDINKLFNTSFSNTHVIVILGVVLVIAIICGFGAFMGGICGLLIFKTFETLTKQNR